MDSKVLGSHSGKMGWRQRTFGEQPGGSYSWQECWHWDHEHASLDLMFLLAEREVGELLLTSPLLRPALCPSLPHLALSPAQFTLESWRGGAVVKEARLPHMSSSVTLLFHSLLYPLHPQEDFRDKVDEYIKRYAR